MDWIHIFLYCSDNRYIIIFIWMEIQHATCIVFRSLVVLFVLLSFGHGFVCPSIYGCWLLLWSLQTVHSESKYSSVKTNEKCVNYRLKIRFLVCSNHQPRISWYEPHTLDICINGKIYSLYVDSAGMLFHPINQCDVMHIMTLIIITTTSVLNVTTYIASYIQ
jgi:hypothetical protein